jgi:hypothetical protein
MSSPERIRKQCPESIVAASLAHQICARIPPGVHLPSKITFLTNSESKVRLYGNAGFNCMQDAGDTEARLWRFGGGGSGDDAAQGMHQPGDIPGFYGPYGNQYKNLSHVIVGSPSMRAVWSKVRDKYAEHESVTGANDVTAVIMQDGLSRQPRFYYVANKEYPWSTHSEGRTHTISTSRYSNVPGDRGTWFHTLFNKPRSSWQLTVHSYTGFQYGPNQVNDYFGIGFLVSFSREEEFYALCRERLKSPNPNMPAGFDLADTAFAPYIDGVFARSFGSGLHCNNVPLNLPNDAHGVPKSTYLQLAHGPCPLVLETIKQVQSLGGLCTYSGEGI